MAHSTLLSPERRYVVAFLNRIMPARPSAPVGRTAQEPSTRVAPTPAASPDAAGAATTAGRVAASEPAWSGQWRLLKYM